MESQTVRVLLTADALYYLKDGEEPIDDDNLVEAFELQKQWPQGFDIIDYEPHTGGLMAVTIQPHRAEAEAQPLASFEYDMYCELFGGWEVQIKMLGADRVALRIWHPSGKSFRHGEYSIETNKFGGKQIRVGDVGAGKGCIFPLKHFKKAEE